MRAVMRAIALNANANANVKQIRDMNIHPNSF